MKTSLKEKMKLRAAATMDLSEGIPEDLKCAPWTMVEEDELWDERISFDDDRGVGVVELILILVVLIALVAIFKTQLTALVNTILAKITSSANAVMR